MSTVQNKLLSLSSISPTFRLQVLDFMIAELLSQVQLLYTEAKYRQTRIYYHFFEGVKAALFVVNVFNLAISQMQVNNSNGYGLFVINSLGRSSISHSQFSHNNLRALDYNLYNPEYCHARNNNVTTCAGGNLVVLFQEKN